MIGNLPELLLCPYLGTAVFTGVLDAADTLELLAENVIDFNKDWICLAGRSSLCHQSLNLIISRITIISIYI